MSSKVKAILIIVPLVLVAGAAYWYLTGSDDSGPATSASLAASASASPLSSLSPSGSPSTSPTPSAATTPMIAVASGPKSDTLALVSTDGDKTVLVKGDGHIITNVAISPSGAYIAYDKLAGKDRWTPWPSTLMVYDIAADAEIALSGPGSSSVFPAFAAKAVGGHAWASDSVLIAVGYAATPKNNWTNGQFWRCDLAAKTVTPLEDGSGVALEGTEPSISADGTRLAFVAYSNYKKEVLNAKGWVIKPARVTETLDLFDGGSDTLSSVATHKRTLDYDSGGFGTPRISPDGTEIFAQQTGSDVGFGITIWGDDGAKVFTSGTLVFPGGADWDTSGSGMLAFAGSKNTTASRSGIMLYDSTAKSLKGILVSKKLFPADVAWSPDGEWLAYTVPSPRYNYRTVDLYLTNAGGTSNTLLLSDAGEPSFGEVAVP